MMATVPHVTYGSGLRKFQADGFLFDRVYVFHSGTIEQADKLFFESARNVYF